MDELERARRAAVVSEALTWLGTPFHHEARVKRAGVDCAQLLYAVYSKVGLIPEFIIPHYPPDWHMHKSEETYLGFILDHAVQIDGPPNPGDIVIYRFGHCYSHAAIVKQWPVIIHSYLNKPCQVEDAQAASYLTHIGENVSEKGFRRPKKFFTLKRWS